jgi:predicted dinucleotide-binding enzyme
MTTTREDGQTQASADALATYSALDAKASDARYEVIRVTRELKTARAAAKAAEKAAKDAEAIYLATPYSAVTS